MKKTQILRIVLLLAMLLLPVILLTSAQAALFLKGLGFTLSILTGLWLLSLWLKDSSIIDIYWGMGFVFIAFFYAVQIGWEQLSVRNMALLAMIGIWGLRLSGYLALRNIGSGEDYRYVEMRKSAGKNWWWVSYLQVFVLQGVLLWIISSVFVPALSSSAPFDWFSGLGLLLWAIGIFFEAAGDWQLRQFKQNPANKGKVLDTGLWRYTRHPNYFGDACLWWGFFCFALSSSNGFFYIFSPLLMTFLLLKISGVAMLEKGLKGSKPKYAEYIRRTSAFIPWPPKSKE